MAEYASNYKGKGGKANIVAQGQTSGAYGNDPHTKAKVSPSGATPLKP